MNREGEYCAMLLLVGGPPANRPERDLSSGNVEWEGMVDPAKSVYSTWAGKVRDIAMKEGWIEFGTELFGWITGFLDWFDSMSIQAEGRERYHRAGHRHG